MNTVARIESPSTFAPSLAARAGRWLLLCAFLLLSVPTLRAQLTYTVENRVITITGYSGTIGQLTIPETIDGLPVRSIENNAFYFRWDMTSVSIPNSITFIGDSTFSECTGLTSVSIPNSVTSVGNSAFYGCTGLTGVGIPNSVTYIGNYAFGGCTGLTSASIPNSVTSIGYAAFWVCTGLTNVIIPNRVTTIWESTFSGCTGLTSVGIPNSVTYIAYYAFRGCTGLTSLIIPNSVISIGSSAFYGCTGLTSLIIPNSVTSIEDSAFSGCTGLTSVSISNSVTSIGASAFSKCTGLTSLSIPNSVTTIGAVAFSECTGLTSVSIPNSVTAIGTDAFGGCTGLTSVSIPKSVTSIGSSAFGGCTGLTDILVDEANPSFNSVNGVLFNKTQTELILYPANKVGAYTLPNSVSSIGDWAFYVCTRLTSVSIPNSVTSIGYSAFHGCTGLTSVSIPNSVTSILTYVFGGCTGLTDISVDGANPSFNSVNGVLFNKTQTLLIRYPQNRGGAYTLPNSVTSIGDFAFSDCTSLTSVSIPKSVKFIRGYAFANCTGLTDISVEEANPSFSSVNGVLFNKTQTLLIRFPQNRGGAYTLPNSVTSIAERAFYGCTGLTDISVDGANSSFNSVNGVLFNKTQTLLIRYPQNRGGAYTLPNSVTSIGDYSFSDCTSLTTVSIPKSVDFIGFQPFSGCTGLTGIYFNGDQPRFGSPFFGPPTSIYHLPGTTGWGVTFAGRPTVLWNPNATTSDPAFGVKAGQFGFKITGTANIPVVVEACDSLTEPVWLPLATITLASGSSLFSDPDWASHPSRVYRFRSP